MPTSSHSHGYFSRCRLIYIALQQPKGTAHAVLTLHSQTGTVGPPWNGSSAPLRDIGVEGTARRGRSPPPITTALEGTQEGKREEAEGGRTHLPCRRRAVQFTAGATGREEAGGREVACAASPAARPTDLTALTAAAGAVRGGGFGHRERAPGFCLVFYCSMFWLGFFFCFGFLWVFLPAGWC